MDVIKQWFISITGIIILSALGEGILPSGAMKKYVRLLFGLILIIAVCRPFLSRGIEYLRIDSGSREAYIETENMEKKERETVLRLYKANLAKQIITSLSVINEKCNFDVQIDVETQNMDEFGKIRGITVTVKTDDSQLYINDEIEEVVFGTYGVDKKNIAVRYMEAE